MKIIKQTCQLDEIKQMASSMFGDLVKAVVDVDKGFVAVDGELHSDLEALLMDNGSCQKDLWGINLYPELSGSDDFIEFDSMINMRPSQGNMTRGVDSTETQQKIRDIIGKRIAS